MSNHALVPDAEPLTWRDIEALPYYIAGLIGIVLIARGIAELPPFLQGETAKAVAIVGLLGLRRAWSGMTG